MKMMWGFRNNTISARPRWVLVLIVVLVVFGLLGFGRVFRFVGSLARLVASPIQNVRSVVSEKIFGENIKLLSKQEIITRYQKLLKENEQLREQQVREDDSVYREASVLSGIEGIVYGTFLIDRGSRDGIRVGDKILLSGFYVGYVSDVFARKARVTMASAPSIETQAVLGENGPALVLVGKGSQNMSVSVPRDVPVAEEQEFFLLGQIAYPVGIVERIIFDARDPFKTILVRAPFNASMLRSVQILKAVEESLEETL